MFYKVIKYTRHGLPMTMHKQILNIFFAIPINFRNFALTKSHFNNSMNKIFKKIAVAAMLLISFSVQGKTLGELNIFNHVGVGVHAATTGFGFEVSTPITNFVALRAGATFMPGFSFTADVDGEYTATVNNHEQTEHFNMDLDAGLKRTQGSVIFNIYPFGSHNAFFVAAGAYFGGKNVISLTGHSEELKNLQGDPYVEIGDYKLPVDKNGNVEGNLRVNNFRPYLGLGYGRAVPKRRVNFGVELGVQFMGKAKVYTDDGLLELNTITNDDDWQKWMDKITVYPVLKFTLSGRIF